MKRTQLDHIIQAASDIAEDIEIVVIGSQAIHAQEHLNLPTEALRSNEVDLFPKNHPDRADHVDVAIGELSQFHQTFGYYAHGVSPDTAILPKGWQDRLAPLKAGKATAYCLGMHDLVLSKYAAGRQKDLEFNRALIRTGAPVRKTLLRLIKSLPAEVDEATRTRITDHIKADFADANPRRRKGPTPTP